MIDEEKEKNRMRERKRRSKREREKICCGNYGILLGISNIRKISPSILSHYTKMFES